MDTEDINLKDIQNYYKENIYLKKYRIYSYNNLLLEFSIEPDDLCHLLFGTINRGMIYNYKAYKGQQGYDNIEKDIITFEKLPDTIKKYADTRMHYFKDIQKLLDKPKGVFFFNENVDIKSSNFFKKVNIKQHSDIEADFMIYKGIEDNKYIHLFLRNVIRKDKPAKLVPVSFFTTTDDFFIKKQKEFKIIKNE